jgi:hypothetical protein
MHKFNLTSVVRRLSVVRLFITTRSVGTVMEAGRLVVDVMGAGMFTPRLHAEAL